MELEDVGEGGELEGVLVVEGEGEVADDGEVEFNPDVEVVVDVPVWSDVAHDVEQEVERHLRRHLHCRRWVRLHSAWVRHRSRHYFPAQQIIHVSRIRSRFQLNSSQPKNQNSQLTARKH